MRERRRVQSEFSHDLNLQQPSRGFYPNFTNKFNMIATQVSPQASPVTKSSARRCLFGRLDSKIVNESLEKELKMIDHKMEEKWEFDFTAEKPIPGGRFLWSPVSKSEYVPGPYLRDYPTKPTRPRIPAKNQENISKGHKRRLDFDLEDALKMQEVAASPVIKKKMSTKICQTSDENAAPVISTITSSPSKRQQVKISVFFQQRKRQRTDSPVPATSTSTASSLSKC